MADYKLKLDIDAALLEKKLEAAAKKVFGRLGGTGGSSGGTGGSNTSNLKHEKFKTRINKMQGISYTNELKTRRKYEHDLKMEYVREKAALRAHNIMLEKAGAQSQRTFRMIGQLLGGSMGGAGGETIDRATTWFKEKKKQRKASKATRGAYDIMPEKQQRKWRKEHGGEAPGTEDDSFNQFADFMGSAKEKFGKATGKVGKRFGKTKAGKILGKNKQKFAKTKGGKAAGKAGGVMAGMGKKIPQAVKLAGIGAALAGGAGLAKMVIDSSPMLKAMLKLLNVGVMLILRPIGDFIGFMLRPLLLHFVRKVAIPAYRSGSKLAKELGPKMGKALLLLFTDLPGFFDLAIVNPIRASIDKTWINIVKSLKDLGNIFNLTDGDDAQNFADNQAWADEQYSKIDEKYPGLFSEGAIDKKLDDLKEKGNELIGPVQPVLTDDSKNTTTAVNELKEKMDVLPDKIGTVIDSGSIPRSLDEYLAYLKLKELKEQQKISNTEQDAIMKVAKKGIGIKTGVDIITGSMIEDVGKAKEREAIELRNEKKKMDKQGKIDKTLLSGTAQKILAAANEYKLGKSAGAQAQAGGVYGSYNPMATEDMGGKSGTGEFEKYVVDGNTCMASREIMGCQNFAATTREEMEIYTAAIEEAAISGESVLAEYNKMRAAAYLTNNAMSATEDQFKAIEEKTIEASDSSVLTANQYQNMLIQASKSNAYAVHTSSQFDNILTHANNANNRMSCFEKANEEIVGTFEGASVWIKSKLNQIANYKTPGGGQLPSAKVAATVSSQFGEGLVRGGGFKPAARYQISFGDGSSKTQGLDQRSYNALNDMRSKGKAYQGKQILSIIKMAKGGIINEPIFGIGQNTGKGYLMGEKGPETVTPGAGTSPGTSPTFNITINASGIGDIERELKPAILRMLKESTSRAGIV
jgi:hypothetical protein